MSYRKTREPAGSAKAKAKIQAAEERRAWRAWARIQKQGAAK